MTKTIVAQRAGLGGDGDGGATGVLCHVSHPATVEVLSQQSSGIRRVSQRRDSALHVPEGAEEGGGVRDVVDGGLLYTVLLHRHGNITVDVALISLSYHLVDETRDIRSDTSKVCCVLKVKIIRLRSN